MYAAVLFPSFLDYKAQIPHFFGKGFLIQKYQVKSVLSYVYVRCGTFSFISYYKAQTPHFFGEGLSNTEVSGFGGVRVSI